MGRLIDGDALYKAMQDAEELARKRVLDTESTLPYPNNLNPAYTRYLAQMDERIKAKKMVADAPTVDAVPVVRCKDCKYWKTGEGVNRSKKIKFCTYAIYHSYARRDEDFCSRGERKDGKDGDVNG